MRRSKPPVSRAPRHASMKQQRPQDYYGSSLRGLASKNKARFDYNYQQRNRRNAMTFQ
jgi:hypothetical protein